MSQLRVTLDHSLEGDLVILRVKGHDIYRSNARNILIPLPHSEAHRLSLEVEIPSKGVFGSCGFRPSEDRSIAVRLESTGILAFQVQDGTQGPVV